MVNQEQKVENDQASDTVIAYLVEKFGEEVTELFEKAESSYAKIKYKGEKDELAMLVEDIHYHPMLTAVKGLDKGVEYLSFLVHKKLMNDIILENKDRIDYIYGSSGMIGMRYILNLINNTFDERDYFRKELHEKYDTKPYSRFVRVNLEFMPEGTKETDIIDTIATKLELSETKVPNE